MINFSFLSKFGTKFWNWWLHRMPYFITARVWCPSHVKVYLISDKGDFLTDQWVFEIDSQKYSELVKSESFILAMEVTDVSGHKTKYYTHIVER